MYTSRETLVEFQVTQWLLVTLGKLRCRVEDLQISIVMPDQERSEGSPERG